MEAVVYGGSPSIPEVGLSASVSPRRVRPGVWLLRIVWVLLPAAAGPAVAGALDGWDHAPRILAEALLWASWALVTVAVLAPRPAGLTATRIVAPGFAAVAVATAWETSVAASAVAIVVTVLATVLAALPAYGRACADGLAYGDEFRFPLKTPPMLAAGPVPVATLLVGAGIATGPLLLASGHVVAGAITTVVGLALAGFLTRALHGLSTRWAVLVPAGITLVDPMTLADPVLFPSEHVAGLAGAPLRPDESTLDLRLGASVGAVAMHLTDDAQLLTASRGRRPAGKVTVDVLLFAPVEPSAFFALATMPARQRRAT
jgi:hypothetical protein